MVKRPISRRPALSRQEREKISRLAQRVRKQLGIEDQHAPNLLKVLEQVQKVFPKLKIRFVSDILLPHADAQALPKKAVILVRKSVRDALGYSDERSRWTIAHELGHIFLNHPRSAYRLRDPLQIRAADQTLELQANYFAGEFLAPRHLARRFKSAEEVKARFKISNEAAIRRIADLDLDHLDKAKQTAMVKAALIRGVNTNPHMAPLVSNLESVSLSITACAGILLNYYDSIRKIGEPSSSQIAAALAVAIFTIRPLRPRNHNSTNTTDSQVREVAAKCALELIGTTLSAELSAAATARTQQLLESSEFPLLRFFVSNIGQYLRQRPDRLGAIVFPSYEQYNVHRDISWTELHFLEMLVGLLTALTSEK